MKVRTLSILCGLVLMVAGVDGKEPLKKKDVQSAATTLQTQLIDRQVSELMADRVGIHKGMMSEELAVMDYISHDELLESESLRFPADELYGTWDTNWVNPFRSKDVAFPDSFQIDCSTFVLPVTTELKVTSKYGPRRRRMHRGIDLKVYVGDTIRAAFSGKVRIKSFERRGYGNYLVIRHPNGLETIYGHLSKYLVTENDIVRAGQPIALGGNTGRSTGSHLHFETRFLGQALDPSDLIDFESGTPYNNFYVFHKGNNQTSNMYTSTSERIVYHRVKQGETLGRIAQIYHTSVNELCRLNGISSNSKLRIGQSIRCGTTVAKTPKKEEVNVASADSTVKTPEPAVRPAAYHKVEAKETLSSIARRHGTTVETLCRLNNILSTDALHAGQAICYRAASKSTGKQELKAAGNPENVESAISDEDDEDEEYADEVPIIPASQAKKEKSVAQATPSKTESQPEKQAEKTIKTDKPVAKTDTKTVVAQTPKQVSPTLPAEKTTVYYQVKKGDTLGAIARQHGVSVDQLCKMNNITTTTVLQIGRSLRCS
jgi:murein DD-endopeptidase MepM/ murein hydrolase activator NlpD